MQLTKHCSNSRFFSDAQKREVNIKLLDKENKDKALTKKLNDKDSNSSSKKDLDCCNYQYDIFDNKLGDKRLNSHKKCIHHRKIITCKHKNSQSLEKSPSKQYFKRRSHSSELDARDIPESNVHQNFSNKLETRSGQSMSSYSVVQKHYKHYIDILHEVKKILKKDIIGKRKLKNILKKQQFKSISSESSQFTKKHDYRLLENSKNEKDDNTKIKLNTLRGFHCSVAVESHNNLDKKYYRSIRSNIKNVEVLFNETSVYNKNSMLSSHSSNLNTQSNITSRTPSPALPLLRDEAILNKNISKTFHQQPQSDINTLENLSNFDLKLCNNLKHSSSNSKYLTIKNKYFNKIESHCKSPFSFKKSMVFDNTKDINNLNKNSVEWKRTYSFYHVSSASQTKSYSRSVTPLKISSASEHWSPTLQLQNNSLSLLVNEDIMISKESKSTVSSTHSSPSRTPSIPESSRSRISYNYLKDYPSDHRRRSRSMSFSKTPDHFLHALSTNSRNIEKRSCSKSSTHTLASSGRHSNNSFSCSSRTRSSISDKTSRPSLSNSSRSRSPSIPRRYGSPSFLDRRRITSARKRPVPYHRSTPSPLTSSSSIESSNYSDWSLHSRKSSHSTSYSSSILIH